MKGEMYPNRGMMYPNREWCYFKSVIPNEMKCNEESQQLIINKILRSSGLQKQNNLTFRTVFLNSDRF